MKHIILFCPGFTGSEMDDTCIPPLQLYVRFLAETKCFKITIISLHYPFRNSVQNWNGMPHHALCRQGFLGKWRTRWAAWQQLKKIHQKTPIDLIHSFWLTDAAWLGRQFSKKNNIPHLVTLMGQDARKSNHFLRFFSLRKMNLVALSRFHAKTFKKSTGIEVSEIIPWGIETMAPFPERERPIDLLGVGSLIPLKNYSLFLEVVATLKLSFPKIQAQILGRGIEYESLKNEIERLGLEGNVELLGKQTRAVVLEKMRQSRVLFHPSEYESYGYVFAEALQNGMSIVSREVGFAASSEQWYLAEDKEGFIIALKQLLPRKTLIKEVVLHTMDATVHNYKELYEGLLTLSSVGNTS